MIEMVEHDFTASSRSVNMMLMHEFHVLELRVAMNVYDPDSFFSANSVVARKAQKIQS